MGIWDDVRNGAQDVFAPGTRQAADRGIIPQSSSMYLHPYTGQAAFGARTVGMKDPKAQGGPAPGSGPGIPTPAESAQMRNAEIEQGRARWRDMMSANPDVQEILKRKKDMAGGLNAQEMQAARDQMIQGQQAQQQGAMRSLYAQQGRSGIRGGMAGAQQARMQGQFNNQRAQQEQKLLLDNYALKRQGLNDWETSNNRMVFGELAQGLGEAGLGVADRTGYSQYLIGQSMADAARQQPKRGFVGDLIGDFF